MLRETARQSHPDPENIGNPMIAPQDYEVHQSRLVVELQNKDLWIRPTDLSWHILILVTVREKLPVKIDCNVGRQGRSQEAEESEKQRRKIGTQSDGTSRLGLGPPNVLLLLGTNGAQTKRVRVLIGSQLIGTAQIKRAEILLAVSFLLAMRSST